MNTDELVRHGRLLRNAAPQAFQSFHAAFVDYANAQYDVVISTDENIYRAQGRAQQCKAILQILERVKNG